MDQQISIFERVFGQPRSIWVLLITSLSLLLLPLLFVYLDGVFAEFFSQDRWRVYLLPQVIILYIWIVSPLMTRMGNTVIESIRPVVQLDDEDFDQQISAVSGINPRHEWIAFGIGAGLGVITILFSEGNLNASWSLVYWLFSISLMYGILAWAIFVSIISTRVNATLHRLPMQIDIFNSSPFEAIGRQSLLLALVFIGGVTISILFTFQDSDLSSPEFWLVNVLFVVFIILIFFLSMRPTHEVLAMEKKRQLDTVQGHINNACRELVQLMDHDQEPGELSGEINALTVYEKRLLAARTWPYNTSMVRTLFFSVLIPIGSILVRVAVDIFFP
jgi:hypothetical protein